MESYNDVYIVADTDYSNFNCPQAVLAMAVAMRKKAMSTISPNTMEFIKVSFYMLGKCIHSSVWVDQRNHKGTCHIVVQSEFIRIVAQKPTYSPGYKPSTLMGYGFISDLVTKCKI